MRTLPKAANVARNSLIMDIIFMFQPNFNQVISRRYRKRILTVFVLLCSSSVLAQDHLAESAKAGFTQILQMSLEDWVNMEIGTVTKTPEKNTLAPATVSVITAEDIARFGYTSVADALRHSAGR